MEEQITETYRTGRGSFRLRARWTREEGTRGTFFAVITDGLSLGRGNLTNLVLRYFYILILAIGMVMVIIAGHIARRPGAVAPLQGAGDVIQAMLVILVLKLEVLGAQEQAFSPQDFGGCAHE